MSTRCADDGVEGLCKDHERGVDAKKRRSSGREESRFEDEKRKNACSANEENEEVDDDDDDDDDGDDDDDVDCVAFEIDEVAEAHEAQHRTEQAALISTLMIASKKRREAEERDALLVQQMAKRQAMERLLEGPCSCGSATAYERCCAVGAYHRDEMELYTPMQ